MEYEIKVFRNPYAVCPLDKIIFAKYPQCIKLGVDGNEMRWDWVNDNGQMWKSTGKS